MLKNVHLKNLALIKEADIELTDGLNILTGETGAGKSIFFGSINIALGAKANKSLIRSGENSALIELLFETDDSLVFKVLKSLDIDPDGKNIIITRKLSENGAISKINGETVTLANLKSITGLLVDFHGQKDNASLLNTSNQLELIDDFGGKEISDLKSSLRNEHKHYRELRLKYKSFDKDEEALGKEITLIRHEINEIEAAKLSTGEDIRLEEEFKKLSNAENVCNFLSNALHYIGEDGGASEKLSASLKEINSAFTADESLSEILDCALLAESLTSDLSRALSDYIYDNGFEKKRFEIVGERLNEINRLKTKYGNTIEDINEFASGLHDKLEEYENYFERREVLKNKISDSAAQLNVMAKELSLKRKNAAMQLESEISGHLTDLNFLNVNFKIQFNKNKTINENGFDKVEFLISVNPGEDLKPLAQIASGGELSRVMLAIKSALADRDNLSTFIFDEIDAGISGRTAQKVSEKLNLLSKNHQLICITHLPQIAAMADSHYLIEKKASDGKTVTSIELLDYDESVNELARLLGGKAVTAAARANASEMKREATILKEKDSLS